MNIQRAIEILQSGLMTQQEQSKLATVLQAKREWVALTDDEIDWILGLAYVDDMELIKTIETKLKDKNG
jgi:hypothetical protein